MHHNIKDKLYMSCLQVSFLFTTPGIPFAPRRFVNRRSAWSPCIWDTFWSPFWKTFSREAFPETFQVTNLKVLFPIEGVLDPVDLPTCCSIEAKVVVPLYATLRYSCPNVTLVNSGWLVSSKLSLFWPSKELSLQWKRRKWLEESTSETIFWKAPDPWLWRSGLHAM